MKYVYSWITAAVFLAISNEICAQSLVQVDSVLTERYYKSSYDTNYVVRPEGRLTLKVRLKHPVATRAYTLQGTPATASTHGIVIENRQKTVGK